MGSSGKPAVVHGNQADPEAVFRICCHAHQTREHQKVSNRDRSGEGFASGEFNEVTGRKSDPAAAHGHGIQLMKAYMDDVHVMPEAGRKSVCDQRFAGVRATREVRQLPGTTSKRGCKPVADRTKAISPL